MSGLVKLLQERNKQLEDFYELNKIELTRFERGTFKNLKKFYSNREVILETLNKLNTLIFQYPCDGLKKLDFKEEVKVEVLEASKYKDLLVREILSQDLKVLSFVEEAKTELIQDLIGLEFSREHIRSQLQKPS